jgi:hypothetical protein
MNPIPTTKAMAPAPGKGISSYPTPVIKDTIIVEVVNAWKGDYVPLEYGAKWDDVPHASVQGSFPDHKLISQAPNSEDGQWVKRIWANDRVDQDTYNYTIKYIEGSKDHPMYVRSYIIPRDEYEPLEDGEPDPLFAGAILTEQEAERVEGELDSQYIKVVRVYETLNGPVVSSRALVDSPLGLVPATVTRQNLINNPLAGVSGSLTTLEDVVKAEDTFKGQRNRIVADSWPTTTGVEYDEQLGLGIYYDQTIVSPSTYTGVNTVTGKEFRPIDQWKSLSRTYDRNKIAEALKSQYYEFTTAVPITLPDKLLNVIPYFGQSYGAGSSFDTSGSTSTGSVSSSNSGSSKSSWSIGGDIYFEIEKGFSGSIEGKRHIFFMEIKSEGITQDSILNTLNNFSQFGVQRNQSDAVFSGTIVSYFISGGSLFGYIPNLDYNGSIPNSINVSIANVFSSGNIKRFNLAKPWVIVYDTGLPDISDTPVSGSLSFIIQGQTIQIAEGGGPVYSPWPYLRLKTENLVVVTGGRSLSSSYSRSGTIGINGAASSEGRSSEFDVNVSANSVNVPETLHGPINIVPQFIGSIPSDTKGVGQPTYGVAPTTLPTTKANINGNEVDAPTFPPGNYLVDSNVELYKWGFVKVTATTVTIDNRYI